MLQYKIKLKKETCCVLKFKIQDCLLRKVLFVLSTSVLQFYTCQWLFIERLKKNSLCPTRDWTLALAIKIPNSNHWTVRESPNKSFLDSDKSKSNMWNRSKRKKKKKKQQQQQKIKASLRIIYRLAYLLNENFYYSGFSLKVYVSSLRLDRYKVFVFNRSIVDLQCVNFCYSAKWLSYICVYICMYILFHILFRYGLSQDIENNPLCYTVGPCCLGFSVLC